MALVREVRGQHPPGQNPPLYSYRVSAQQLRELRDHVARGLCFLPEDHAAFCLFAAWEFCHRHDGGAWSWRPVEEAIERTLDPQQREQHVLHGMDYWGREVLVLGGRRRFLTTLACEGGLPLKLLEQDGYHLRLYFKNLLAYSQASSHATIFEVASRLAVRLPKTLRNEIVYRLAASLVQSLQPLREEVGQRSEGTDPIEYLDRSSPNWRRSIPLPLEEDIARQLLRGLLTERVDDPHELSPLVSIQTELFIDVPSRIRIGRSEVVPTAISERALSQALDVATDGIPPRCDVQLHTQSGRSVSLATGYRRDDGRFQLRSYPIRQMGHDPSFLGALVGTATSGGRLLTPRPFPIAEALPPVPWFFRDGESDPHRLVAWGSFRTPATSVLIALPPDSELEADGADIETVGDVADRTIVRFQGHGGIRVDDDAFQVRTRQSMAEEEGVVHGLRGRSLSFQTHADRVWLGAPDVIAFATAGGSWPIPRASVEWKGKLDESWVRLDDRALGTGRLRVRAEDGSTAFATIATIFPLGAQIQIRPGRARGEGTIVVTGVPIRDGIAVGAEHIALSVRAEGDAVHLDVRASGVPPDSVEVELLLDPRGTARLRLPFPAADAVFSTHGGTRLPDGEGVSLGSLSSIRARVLTQRPGERYLLEAASMGRPPVFLAPLRAVDRRGVHVELGLDELRDPLEEMLGLSEDLDSHVYLRIKALGLTTRTTRLQVRRYDVRFERIHPANGEAAEMGCLLRIPDGALRAIANAEPEDLTVKCTPLWQPSAEPRALPKLDGSRWWFDYADSTPGPWLVTGWLGDDPVVRPLCISVRPEEAEPNGELESAIFAPGFERPGRFAALAARLAANRNHPDWPRVEEMLDTLGTLPAPTYDVVRALAGNPDAAAHVALVRAQDGNLLELWSAFERLPFLWTLVPVSSWIAAADAMWKGLAEVLPRHELAETAFHASFQALTRKVGQVFPAINTIHHFLQLRGAHVPQASKPVLQPGLEGVLRHQLGEERQDLLRAATAAEHDAYPPPWPSAPLDEYVHELGVEALVMPLWTQPEHEGDRCAVLNVPVLSAAISLKGLRVSDEQLFTLRMLRHFNTQWFERAHSFYLTEMLRSEHGEEL